MIGIIHKKSNRYRQMNTLLRKIIRSGVGRARFIMATLGLGVALVLILLAVQAQVDFNDLLHGKFNKNETADFLVVNKVIDAENQVSENKNAFSQAEIDDVRKQPFVQSLGEIKANNFTMKLESYSESMPFYTDGFCEAVPDEFIDVKSEQWKWNEGQKDLPIIVPSSWLDIYNFGMSLSQKNLPQLSPEAIKALPLKVIIRGADGSTAELVGHVVGLSDRIVSVLVPINFLNWANKNYGYNTETKSTRLVIKTNDPSDPNLVKYLETHKLKTNTDKTRFSEYRQKVNLVVGVISGFGVVMLLFALLVFSLFIQLTIASCKEEINLLITLGTSPKQLGKFLMKQFFPANVLIMALCIVLMAGLQYIAYSLLQKQNMFISLWISPWTIAAAVAVLVMVWLVYKITIRKYVKA